MIQIKDKYRCCGCEACTQKCPKQCISMNEDSEGFLYPNVDLEKCVDCGLCEKVCPYLKEKDSKEPLISYGAINVHNEVRQESSSGGVFTAIANKVISDGGVAFGAQYDENWNVVHQFAETIDDCRAFRGSKYVQSRIGDTYKQVEFFLREGRSVLFSGTPCQISALKNFLCKDYDNLVLVDIVCHGVPSPRIWKEYLQSLNLHQISSISHKDKSTGWRSYSFTIQDDRGEIVFKEKASDNKFLSAFIDNLILRPSCFSCPAKSGRSGADITLADFWGVEHIIPQIDDNKGISFISCNSERGKNIIEGLDLNLATTDYQLSIKYNSCMVKSTPEPAERAKFWVDYSEKGINALLTRKKKSQSIIKRIIKRLLK